MMRLLKKFVRRQLNSAGFDLTRLSPDGNNASYQLLKGLERFGATVVLDVGANTGQFASALQMVGYKGRIISFEPLAEAHRQLSSAASVNAGWTVHPRCAVGADAGEISINIAGNSVSSSVLPMLAAHSDAAQESTYVGAETVPLVPLDEVMPAYLTSADRVFLKIDTQGYEWQVLDGAAATLDRAAGVMCELSLVPLYDGQKLWLDIIARLEHQGFTLWSLTKGFTDPRSGRTLQVDATFFRA